MSSISDIVFLLLIYFMVVTVFQQDIGMPFVLLYTAGVYYIFRGKVTVDSTSY